MKTFSTQVEIVLPTTITPVLDLLTAIAKTLETDAVRYCKAYGVTREHPAVKDKTDTAARIRKLIGQCHGASKKRWAAHMKDDKA